MRTRLPFILCVETELGFVCATNRIVERLRESRVVEGATQEIGDEENE
jgi:hypothetical protein